MIGKLKEIMEVQDQVAQLKNNMNYATNAITEFKNELTTLKGVAEEQKQEIRAMQEEFNKEFAEQVAKVKEVSDEFSQAMFDFKVFKANLQKQVMEKFRQELEGELKGQLEGFADAAKEYEAIKNKIATTSDSIDVLGQSITKLSSISGSIKKEDFELTKHARMVLSQDKEKLELMRKIETLERLVSKMRRDNPTQRMYAR